MSAKTHTHGSNRKGKESLERKVVYKSVLDNPLRIRWPSIPVNVQNSLLARLVAILDGLSEYNQNRDQLNRKRKRALKGAQEGGVKSSKKRRKTDATGDAPVAPDEPEISEPDAMDASSASVSAIDPPPMDVDTSVSEPPSIQQHIIVGINAVTKRLESQAQACRKHVKVSTRSTESGNEEPSSTPVKIVFVCRADVDPPILIDHLPHLVAAINSTGTGGTVVLVPLPKGAELTLAAAVGVRRAAVIALDSDSPGLSTFDSFLSTIPLVSAPWLKPPPAAPSAEKRLVPTHIKQLRTSAPKDMKASKEQRAAGKAAAKEKKKQKNPLPKEKTVAAS